MTDQPRQRRTIPALGVHQWLEAWDEVQWDEDNQRGQPLKQFYLFSLPAHELMGLCGIQRRTTEGTLPRTRDMGIQRGHDAKRSEEIREYVQFGYPWSELSQARRQSGDFSDLRKPGWLPTSIVVNILRPEDKRRGRQVHSDDLVTVVDQGSPVAEVVLPSFEPDGTRLPPVEIIDGQHRLYAFQAAGADELQQFEIPVVAFYGLQLSWQAYLFWTINIKPVRINPSLAFDLYPLLRQEDWLERFHGHSIYRETRAQELTSLLWSHPDSPWYQRIDMLGERGRRYVTQNAWVRSLFASFVKLWDGPGLRGQLGGLFGATIGDHETVLPWNLRVQAAFLILAWRELRDAIGAYHGGWARALRQEQTDGKPDPAFEGAHSLLNTEQGVRGFLYVTNDLCFVASKQLGLADWIALDIEEGKRGDGGRATDTTAAETDDDREIRAALGAFEAHAIGDFVRAIARCLATFDWCTSDAGHLPQEEKERKMALRGSGGYALLRRQLLEHLTLADELRVAEAAREVLDRLG